MGRKDISDYSRDFFHFWSGESAHFVAITKIEAIASFTFLSSKIWYGNSTLRVILDTAQKRIRGEPGYDKLMDTAMSERTRMCKRHFSRSYETLPEVGA